MSNNTIDSDNDDNSSFAIPSASSTTMAHDDNASFLKMIQDQQVLVKRLVEKVQQQQTDIKQLNQKVENFLENHHAASRSASPRPKTGRLMKKYQEEEEVDDHEGDIENLNEKDKNSSENPSSQKNDINSPTVVNDDERYLNRVRRNIFPGSTHRFLFLDYIHLDDGMGYKVRPFEKLVAPIVVFLQIYAYFLIWFLIVNQYYIVMKERDSATIGISRTFCYDTKQDDNWYEAYFTNDGAYSNLTEVYTNGNATTTQELLQLLQCDDPSSLYGMIGATGVEAGGSFNLNGLGPFSFFLAGCFLLPDFFESYVLFRLPGWQAKLAAFILYMLTFFALFVARLGLQVAGAIGFLDAFFLVVGIVFVHDLDEAVGKLFDVFHAVKRPRLEISYWAFLFISTILLPAFAFQSGILEPSFHFDFFDPNPTQSRPTYP